MNLIAKQFPAVGTHDAIGEAKVMFPKTMDIFQSHLKFLEERGDFTFIEAREL